MKTILWCLMYLLCVSIVVGDTLNKVELKVSDTSFAAPDAKYKRQQLPPCVDCNCGERNEEPRVVGGSGSNVNAFPWIARLIYHKSFGCGASLINDKYVITAAHCVKGFMWFMFRVTFGEHDRCVGKTRPETRYLLKMYVHNFTLTDLTNDVSLLLLNAPMTYSYAVRPVCLPTNPGTTINDSTVATRDMTHLLGANWWKLKMADEERENLYYKTMATVAGWGAKAETGNWSCTLLEAQIPVLSNEECRNTNYNESKIRDVMMCAGYPATAHKDACTGDSGGPLVAENEEHAYELIGIVSWGYGCARKGFPGVYTRLNKYLDWIRDNTQDACYCAY